MYLTFDQVILIGDKSKHHSDDPVIYIVEHPRLGRVLTMDATYRPEVGSSDPYGYGWIYEDASHDLCVIPNIWSEQDANLCKAAYPEAFDGPR